MSENGGKDKPKTEAPAAEHPEPAAVEVRDGAAQAAESWLGRLAGASRQVRTMSAVLAAGLGLAAVAQIVTLITYIVQQGALVGPVFMLVLGGMFLAVAAALFVWFGGQALADLLAATSEMRVRISAIGSDASRVGELERRTRELSRQIMMTDADKDQWKQTTRRRELLDAADVADSEGRLEAAAEILREFMAEFPDDSARSDIEARLETLDERVIRRAVRDYRVRINKFIDAGEWAKVRDLVEELAARYPKRPRVVKFVRDARGLLRDREKAEVAKVDGMLARLDETGEWSEAMALVQELERKFPESPRVKDLAVRVRAERMDNMAGEKKAMEARIKDLVADKKWSEALAKSKQYLSLYPTGPEADELRSKLPKIQEYASKTDVKDLFHEVKRNVTKKRYRKAYDLTLRLIKDHPSSPEAEKLRESVAGLRRRAEAEPD